MSDRKSDVQSETGGANSDVETDDCPKYILVNNAVEDALGRKSSDNKNRNDHRQVSNGNSHDSNRFARHSHSLTPAEWVTFQAFVQSTR
jgi:hypothetical protein